MSNTKNAILKRLTPPVVEPKKQIVLSLPETTFEKLAMIAETLSMRSGTSISRNVVIEDAIDAYVEDAILFFNDTANGTEQESNSYDTVVFPAHVDGFRQAFLGENKWYHPRVKDERIPYLKHIAIYVGKPISKITHYAKIGSFEPVEIEGKKRYIIHFDGQAIELENSIPLGKVSPAATRAPRYTTIAKLLAAQDYGDL